VTRTEAGARQVRGVELLERAIAYALGAVQAVSPSRLDASTPCRDWDLRALLHHVDDSLAALQEGLGARSLGPDPGLAWDRVGDPARRFRGRARRLLAALTRAGDGEVVAIADLPLGAGILASAGAIEIAVHGWDIARACRWEHPVPHGLAVELLSLCPLLVDDAGRGGQFAAPVAVGPAAGPAERLIAFLGRDPAT
jgi:uncharacterized protein (TIGR03086 family)